MLALFLADPAEPEFISTVCAAFGQGVIGGQGCNLSARELPRFENSRNVEVRALSHLHGLTLSLTTLTLHTFTFSQLRKHDNHRCRGRDNL